MVVARYVNRRLTEALIASLREGGFLVYEQHFVSTQQVDGPRSCSFRLQPNELLDMFRDLRVLPYREALMTDPDERDHGAGPVGRLPRDRRDFERGLCLEQTITLLVDDFFGLCHAVADRVFLRHQHVGADEGLCCG